MGALPSVLSKLKSKETREKGAKIITVMRTKCKRLKTKTKINFYETVYCAAGTLYMVQKL